MSQRICCTCAINSISLNNNIQIKHLSQFRGTQLSMKWFQHYHSKLQSYKKENEKLKMTIMKQQQQIKTLQTSVIKNLSTKWKRLISKQKNYHLIILKKN